MKLSLVLISLLSGLSAMVLAGNWNVPLQARDLQNPTLINNDTRSRGAAIYTEHCTECHDEQGRGVGEHLDYSLQSILSIPSQPGNQPLSDGELYWKITHGIGKMPSFAGVLTDEERWLMVNHIRLLPSEDPPAKGHTHPMP